jgi:spermidine/putrescine transport system substrate-binding protein
VRCSGEDRRRGCSLPAWPPGRLRRRWRRRWRGRAGGHHALLELAALHRLRRDDEDPTDARGVHEEDGHRRPVLRGHINDNAQYFGKIQGPLSQGRGIDRDIIVISDNSRFPGLLISKGWAEELDRSLIPNIENVVDAQKSPPFDPERKYSLPWQSGMTGIAWNENVTGPVESMQQLLEDPKLKGKVTMLMELADSVGLVMLQNGDEPENVTDESWKRAMDTVQKAVDSGQIRRFTGNDYAQPLANGDIAAAVAWSGDVVQLVLDNPKLKWAVPEKGGMWFTDNMLIPREGSVPTASTYMNYVYDPKAAAQIAAYVNYVTPVKGAREELAKTDPETAKNELIFPSDETLAEIHQFDDKALQNDSYIEQWQRVLGA